MGISGERRPTAAGAAALCCLVAFLAGGEVCLKRPGDLRSVGDAGKSEIGSLLFSKRVAVGNITEHKGFEGRCPGRIVKILRKKDPLIRLGKESVLPSDRKQPFVQARREFGGQRDASLAVHMISWGLTEIANPDRDGRLENPVDELDGKMSAGNTYIRSQLSFGGPPHQEEGCDQRGELEQRHTAGDDPYLVAGGPSIKPVLSWVLAPFHPA
jgi:hypothetical protein